MSISQASYSASVTPAASNSSNIMVTLTPLGVASEYSWKGCLPTGSALSVMAPAMGRLVEANLPPDSLSHVHFAGGV